MVVKLEDARIKLGRADDHLKALNRGVQRFVNARTYDVYSDYEPQSGDRILRLRVLREPRLWRWGAMAGDVVHTLRTALDHAVWTLTIVNRGIKPPFPLTSDWRGIEFPVFREKPVYLYGNNRKPGKNPLPHDSGLYKIRGVDPRLKALFQRLQPFRDGPRRDRNSLQVLHQLDLIDKHRNIPVLASYVAPQALGVNWGPIPPAAVGLKLEPTTVYPGGPFKDGTPLGRVRQSGGSQARATPIPVQVDSHLAFSIELQKGRPTMGLPLLPALRVALTRVNEILDLLENAI